MFLLVGVALVLESMLLSVFEAWTRAGMLAAITAGLGVAAAAWAWLGRPRPPQARPAVEVAREALRDPLVAFVVLAATVALGYELVVALLIPPLDIDVLAYHLPRIVMWMQQHAIAAIPNAPGSNLDGNPPGAEIAKGVTMLLAESDRYVGLVQALCVPAGSLAVAGVARRLGLDTRGAIFGGAIFATFPIVALQAPTAHNDLIVAAALIVALYFLLGSTIVELGLGSVAVGLALTTKVSGILGLASIALVALVAARGRRPAVCAAIAAGCVLGSWWYVYNLWRVGSWDGGLGTDYGQVPSRAPDEILLRLERYLLQVLDLGGAVGRDKLVFPVVALVLLVIGLALRRSSRRAALGVLVAAGLVAITPWLVIGGHRLAARALAKSWVVVGRSDVIGAFPLEPEARPWPGEAWFGPAFPLLIVATVVAIALAGAGKGRLALLTAGVLAPALLFLVNASAFVWDGARGRFFIVAGALAASTFGLVLRFRPVAWAASVVAVVTLGLSFVHFHGRPLGVELFEPVAEPALWGKPRWRAQEALAPDPEASSKTAKWLATEMPPRATVGVHAGNVWTMYALMGWGPWRRIEFLRPGEQPGAVDFVAFAPGVAVDPMGDEWTKVPAVTTWGLYQRRTGD